MNRKTFLILRNIVMAGVFSAVIFVLTKFVSIPIPTPLGKTAISLGNTMCILASALFGPLVGGFAAGIGNALVDLTDPLWAPEFLITFINKFLMAFVAGLVMRYLRIFRENIRVWLAGLAGAVTYTVLYVVKNILSGVFLKGFSWNVAIVETITLKLPVSLVNGVLAVICAGCLYLALKKPLHRAHII